MGRYCPNCPDKHQELKLKRLKRVVKVNPNGIRIIGFAVDKSPLPFPEIHHSKKKKKDKHKVNPKKKNRKVKPKPKPQPKPISKVSKKKPQPKPKSHHLDDRERKSHLTHHVYYGIDRDEDVHRPVEGDVFLNILTGEWAIYRFDFWNPIPSPGPRSYLGPSIDPESSIPYPKEGSLYLDANGRIYIYQGMEWQLVPMNFTPINSKQQPPSKANYSIVIQSNQYQLEPSEVYLKIETTGPAEAQKLMEPRIGQNLLQFPVLPETQQRVKLTELNGMAIQVSIEQWIEYVDQANNQTWQTVLALTDLTLTDVDGKVIHNYQISADDDPETLMQIMGGKYITTSVAKQNIILQSPDFEIAEAEWTYRLLAHPKGNTDQFYLVKDFQDFDQQLSSDLPLTEISLIS